MKGKGILRKFVSLALVATFVVSGAVNAFACTSFYMGKSVTDDGSYIWGRSEDIGASYRKLFNVHQSETHQPGEYYVSSTGFKWPYPERTLRYIFVKDSILNENISPEPYAEAGVNEYNVSISSTVTLSGAKSAITAATNDPMVSARNGGLPETDTASVVLMNAKTAREACELLANIVDTVGAAGREGSMISDPNEVWFFQILSGHQYVAAKCPDDMIGFSPNITGNVDMSNPDNYIASPGLYTVAEKAGTLVKDANGFIKIADSYASSAPNHQSGRLRIGHWYLKGLEDVLAQPTSGVYMDYFLTPRPEKNYTLYEAMRLLAFRGEGTDWYAGNGTGNGSAIGNDGTVEAHVFQVRQDMPADLATIEWLCLTPAEFGIYIPYYGSQITEVFEKGYTPDAKTYNDTNVSLNSAYSVYRELYTLCKGPRSLPTAQIGTLENRTRYGAGVKDFWERYQKSLIEQQAAVDEDMLAFYEQDPALASEKATMISKAISEEAYAYAAKMLAELKAFQAAGTEGAFVPSVLNDPEALPNYAFVKGLEVKGATTTLNKGKAMEITPVVSPANAAVKDIIWTSSNEAVAKVENGVVTALKSGTVTITATTVDGGYVQKVIIRVM